MNNYWLGIEKQWSDGNSAALEPFSNVCAQTHEFVAEIAQHPDFTDRPPSKLVVTQRLLLRRLGEELRGVELLALNGHGFQAISAAANLFEQSHFMTHASTSEEVAAKYLDSDDHKQGVSSVRTTVEASGRQRGWDQTRTDDEYSIYSFLCGFKHNNAVMQRVLRLPMNPDLVLGQIAISKSIWFVLSAVGLLAVVTLALATAHKAIETCNRLMASVKSLPEIEIETS